MDDETKFWNGYEAMVELVARGGTIPGMPLKGYSFEGWVEVLREVYYHNDEFQERVRATRYAIAMDERDIADDEEA